jgi:hypothetical protein
VNIPLKIREKVWVCGSIVKIANIEVPTIIIVYLPTKLSTITGPRPCNYY